MKVKVKNNLKFEGRTLEDKQENFYSLPARFFVTATAFYFPEIIKIGGVFTLKIFENTFWKQGYYAPGKARFHGIFTLNIKFFTCG